VAVYVIDSSRPLPPTHGDGEVALALANRDTVVLAAGSEIAAYGYNATAIAGANDTTLLLDGRVHSEHASAVATHGSVIVGATGTLDGAEYGIFLLADYDGRSANVVNNAGRIHGDAVGLVLESSRNVITNSGEISGHDGIYFDAYDELTDQLVINNTGLIRGETAIRGLYYGATTVTNSGRIEGDVILGTNAWIEPAGPSTSIYDGRGGTITGTITFGEGNDIAYGGAGSETFSMGGHTNFVDGGGGIDTLRFVGAATVDLRITDRQQTTALSFDTIRNIENLVGGRRNDLFCGNGGDNTFTGNAGNDTLDGGGGMDVAVFSGRFSDYSVTAQVDGSFLVADRRSGSPDGSDVLRAIEYAEFADRTISLAVRSNSAPTFVGIDNLRVDAGSPAGTVVGHLRGTDPDGDPLGYFLVSNPGGHLRIHGDRLVVDKPFTGAADIDIVVRASDPSGASIDGRFTIDVAAHAVVADPSEGPRVLKGGSKADRLVGGTGDDRLNGGLGMDTLKGGGGDDLFAFTTRLGRKNVDVIADFRSADDGLQLSHAIFGHMGKGMLKKAAFCLGATAQDTNDRILYDPKTGLIAYDADGSGTAFAAVAFARVKAGIHITATDFIIA
jgi:serralysin